MNFSYQPPPSASTGALRSLKPDYPEEGQSKLGVAYPTEAPAPTYSTGMINSSDPQFLTVGQRGLPGYESALLPPQLTAVRTLEHSTNQLTGDGSRTGWDEANGGGSISNFVKPNYSSNGAVDDQYYSTEGAPGISGYAQRDRSNSGFSAGEVGLPNANHSMTGNKFKDAYKMFSQYDY